MSCDIESNPILKSIQKIVPDLEQLNSPQATNLVLIENRPIEHDVPYPTVLSKENVPILKSKKFKLKRDKDLIFTNSSENVTKSLIQQATTNLKNSDQICLAIKEAINKILNNKIYGIFIFIVTIFALLLNDFSEIFLNKKYDSLINNLLMIGFILFILEWILSCLAKKDYFCSFYFWLDLFSSLSYILDIDFLFLNIFTYAHFKHENSNTKYSYFNHSFSIGNFKNNTISNVSFPRIENIRSINENIFLKVLGGVRLIRTVKLYKSARSIQKKLQEEKMKKEIENKKQLLKIKNEQKALASVPFSKSRKLTSDFNILKLHKKSNSNPDNLLQSKNDPSSDNNMNSNLRVIENLQSLKLEEKVTLNSQEELLKSNLNSIDDQKLMEDDLKYDKLADESKLNRIICEAITRKSILLIFLMFLLLPILDVTFWNNGSILSYNLYSSIIDGYYVNENHTFLLSSYDKIISMLKKHEDPIFPIINITIQNNILYVSNLKDDDLRYTDLNAVAGKYFGLTLILYSSKYTSWLYAIINIVRTLFICITITVSALVLENDTKRIVLDPIEVMIEIVEKVAKDPMSAQNFGENLNTQALEISEKDNKRKQEKKDLISGKKKQYEIYIIQSAIIRISTLLSIGFGEAGVGVIRENFSGTKDMNPMLKGNKIMGIFGFCDIRDFPAINEALEEKTVILVNEIADIVHSSVDKFGGAANKNIGDAYLNIWKFKNSFKVFDNESSENQLIADSALLGFLNIIIKVNRDETITAYKNNPLILNKIKDFKFSMGLGLHLGWAIEGSIGSSYKIDASYLSPNVNISARLEGATRQYDVPILLSGQVYNCLSDELKEICRLIDIVTVKGAMTLTKLYTVDVNLDLTCKKKTGSKISSLTEKRAKLTKKRLEVINGIEQFGSVGAYAITRNSFYELLNINRPNEFLINFNEGFQNYIDGEWIKAKEFFHECLKLDPKDGPTKTLENFIRSYNYQKPSSWMGYRPLSSK